MFLTIPCHNNTDTEEIRMKTFLLSYREEGCVVNIAFIPADSLNAAAESLDAIISWRTDENFGVITMQRKTFTKLLQIPMRVIARILQDDSDAWKKIRRPVPKNIRLLLEALPTISTQGELPL